ncbi:hypothetical protein AWN68_08275 [Roseivirga echinicomitans]|uniref:Uncharacterized protein n=1 Tax=Roseivirga echinicomitans TaxID=296218 RepID=A0A150X1U8_9BACT|nr:hypothetical protein AWN68_08275 [Roseivirga echinicomitans]
MNQLKQNSILNLMLSVYCRLKEGKEVLTSSLQIIKAKAYHLCSPFYGSTASHLLKFLRVEGRQVYPQLKKLRTNFTNSTKSILESVYYIDLKQLLMIG